MIEENSCCYIQINKYTVKWVNVKIRNAWQISIFLSNDTAEETSVQVGLNVNQLTNVVFPNLSNGFSTTSLD